jgi:hypothetical protein
VPMISNYKDKLTTVNIMSGKQARKSNIPVFPGCTCAITPGHLIDRMRKYKLDLLLQDYVQTTRIIVETEKMPHEQGDS